MVMENDELKIPEKYLKMSASELKAEEEKILKKLLAERSQIPTKSIISGNTSVKFNI